ncbi:MAG: type II toxin-antitoxin system RelB/DinJ family antitoxin [Oscillospiraceae bacterium]
MATKTANVLARVEPEIKEKAEEIMTQLGVPASVVINMLYKQIIMTKSIPFSLAISSAPVARDEMNARNFDAMMQRGLDDARAGRSRPVAEAFDELRREI